MTLDGLLMVQKQLQAQHAERSQQAQAAGNDVVAIGGALHLLNQLIENEKVTAAGGPAPAQGIVAPVLPEIPKEPVAAPSK